MSRLKKAEEERRRKSEQELKKIDNTLKATGSSLEHLIREIIEGWLSQMEAKRSC